MDFPQGVKDLLSQRQLAPKKSLGQNFLKHRGTAQRIVELAGVLPEDTIVELGVGMGALTHLIAARAKRVIGLEIDAGIVRWQQEEGHLPANVDLRHEDLLKSDFAALAKQSGQPLKIIANLPYVISSPLLFKLIANREIVAWAVLMLQKEVALRLTASVGTKAYGILSVLLGACATIEPLLDLGPEQFHPRPKIISTVARITLNPPPPRAQALPPFDWSILTRMVKAAFQQRRKTLLNALSSAASLATTKDEVAACLAQAGIRPDIRAERLTIEDYVTLARTWESLRGAE